jgi:uncharacterized protein YecT (DUF1311 family)
MEWSRMPLYRRAACLVALLIATAAAAGDADVINACLKSAYSGDHGEAHACIGLVADPCLQKPENQSTQAMVACTDSETKIWDALLNAEYDRLLGVLQGKAADDVRQAQRVWITLRDADCAVPYQLFEGGTMAQPIGANCVLAHTANRMMQVRSWREMVQPEQE